MFEYPILSSASIVWLRKICRELSLSEKGNKANLINRILDYQVKHHES